MKKLFLLSVLMLLPMLASADAVEINEIYYNLIEKAGQAEVTRNSNRYSGSVVIPESIVYEGKNYSVTSIGQEAFFFCIDLTSVTIPNSVTSIGSSAFYGCWSLTSVTIPNSVTSIGKEAFYNCGGLTSVTIPNSVTSIENSAFSGCSGLTSITIPNSVTSIGNHAFYNCSGLTSVTIPNSVTSIGKEAFYNCVGLTSVHISDIVAWCKISFDVDSNPLDYAHHLFLNGSEVKNLVIPNSVTSIGNSAFSGCRGLTSVTIPNSVTSIGNYAFYNCSGLTSVTIPNSVTSIGERAFSYCSGLTSVTIPNSVTYIGDGAFSGCSGLTSVTIPNSVTYIGDQAFQSCSGLTSVTIPNSVTSIGDGAFNVCSGLTSVTIPNSVTYIGNYAFYGCSGLTSVTIGSGVKQINQQAFAECKELKDVYCLAESVPNAKTDAFKDSYPEYTTLHVPANSLNAYKNTAPWSSFGKIVSLNGGETPEAKKCATPTISYGGKKLTFNCETEGVEYVYEIKDADIKKGYDSEVSLSATYEISVYATKAGYENSDVATAILVWGNASFTETTPEPSSVRAMKQEVAALITSSNGIITVSCEAEGQPVSVYAVNGQLLGTSTINSGRASVTTLLRPGDISLVKIGSKTVKVVIK